MLGVERRAVGALLLLLAGCAPRRALALVGVAEGGRPLVAGGARAAPPLAASMRGSVDAAVPRPSPGLSLGGLRASTIQKKFLGV